MKIYIKNMVCDRCIMVVRQLLEAQLYTVGDVTLGEAELLQSDEQIDIASIHQSLKGVGFELIENKKRILTEKIKTLVIEKIYRPEDKLTVNFSDYLAEKTGFDYYYLSHLFSEEEHLTIEKFIISIKIKRIKELLKYGELTISEIAWEMGYSSVQALSAQFKKMVSMTPGEYKRLLAD